MRVTVAALAPLIVIIGASPSLSTERLPLKNYTTSDNLAHNGITRIVRDARGFLWFGTQSGLSRFDGYQFVSFGVDDGLPAGPVNDFLETRAGNFWIGTDNGLIRFDPRGVPRLFTRVGPDDMNYRTRTIKCLREDADGTIWVGTRDGLFRLRDQQGRAVMEAVEIGLAPHPDYREITDVLADADGTMWIATTTGLFRRSSDGRAIHYGAGDGRPLEHFFDLMRDHAGRLWAASDAGLQEVRVDNNGRPPVFVSTLTMANGLPSNRLYQILETEDQRLWMATTHGLAEFLPGGDGRGSQLRTYDIQHGLIHHHVTALGEDSAGNLWMGTRDSGVMKLARGGLTTYSDPGHRLDSINAVFEDQAGDICFRGNAGAGPRDFHLGCLDSQRLAWFGTQSSENWAWVHDSLTLQARDGEWWLGSSFGVFRFAAAPHFESLATALPIAVYTTRDGLADNQVYRLFEDSRGDIWISTYGTLRGVARWERSTGRIRDLTGTPPLPPATEDLARSFGEDADGNIWIGFKIGLARYSAGQFAFFTAADGLPPSPIVAIHTDRSKRLWLGSQGSGLIRVDGGGGVRPAFVSFGRAQGLSSAFVDAIAEDASGRLYVAGGGLDRLDPSTGRVQRFTAADGVPPGAVRAAFRDRHGSLWFGTTSGLMRLSSVLDRPVRPPPIFITGLRIAGAPRPVSITGETPLAVGDLSPRQNQVEVDYVGLSFAAGDVVKYQYKLEGADVDWTVPTERRTVTYPNLGPDRYTFRVRAVTSGGVVSSEPASLSFTVLAPVWRRSWFLAIVAITGALAGYWLYRYRVSRLLEIAHMRTHIATDLHDDIGANLTRIALLSEAARGAGDSGPLASIASIARESVSSMSDIVWAINPKRESLRDLVRRMRQHAEEVFAQRHVDLVFEAPADSASPRLGMEVRRDLLLIFKEAVSNAARHSRCSKIAIHLRLGGGRLELVIADNGVGFARDPERDGQGLSSMERRAGRLRGSCRIESAPGRGTTVAVDIPV